MTRGVYGVADCDWVSVNSWDSCFVSLTSVTPELWQGESERATENKRAPSALAPGVIVRRVAQLFIRLHPRCLLKKRNARFPNQTERLRHICGIIKFDVASFLSICPFS